MKNTSDQSLNRAYETFVRLVMSDGPIDQLDDLATMDAMGYGTTIDEVIHNLTELKNSARLQREQTADANLHYDSTPMFHIVMNHGKSAVLVDELQLNFVFDGNPMSFQIRLSVIMELVDGKWKAVHFHASKPEYDSGGSDPWHKEEWKKKNEELQRMVDEKTADLAEKNRELEMEAALERVRKVAMSMHKPDDLLDVCQIISEQLEILNLNNIRNVQVAIINESKKSYSNYQFFAAYAKRAFEETGYENNPASKGMVQEMQKSANSFFIGSIKDEELEKFNAWRKEYGQFPDPIMDDLTEVFYYFYSIGEGGLGLTTYQAIDDKELDIFKRFHLVFKLAYRRFIDIQQAEAQAKEAKIEAALERIRSHALAMRNSTEVGDVSDLLFSQLEKMDINPTGFSIMVFDREQDKYELWRAKEVAHQGVYETFSIKAMYDKLDQYIPGFTEELESEWNGGSPFFIAEFSGRKRISFLEANRQMGNYTEDQFENALRIYPDPIFWHLIFFRYGWLGLIQKEQLPAEDLQVIRRFADVFEFAHTRFLDLQKAETQAKEAQIETALERVRSRSLAMHKSEELEEVIRVVYEQFLHLNILVEHSGFIIDYKEQDEMNIWLADRFVSPFQITIPYFDSPHWNSFIEAKQNGVDFFTNLLPFEEKNRFYQDLFKLIPALPKESQEAIFSMSGLAISTVLLDNVGLYIENFSGIPYSDEENNTLIRFGKVFQQSYTRFLDLQKAEVQAREARIEAALERVRSKTMGMQRSDELQDAAVLMFQQIESLGVNIMGCGFNIWEDDRKEATAWMSGLDRIQPPFKTSSSRDIFLRIYEAAQRGESFFVEEQAGSALVEHYKYMASIPVFKKILDNLAEKGLSVPSFQIMHCAFFSQGYLMFITHEAASNTYDIFKRFAKVFEQTYTRFIDLQKAEDQALEALKQSSLDRVRGQIASMRTTKDLERITPIIWHELITLDVPLIRCGVFIVDEEQSNVRVYLTTPEVKPLAVLNLSFDSNELTSKTVDHWRKGQIYYEHWNRDQFIQWAKSMLQLGQIQDQETYQGSKNPPETLDLHFVPFTQGMLYVGNTAPLSDENIQLVKSLADAFSIAYARYEDFNKLEKAKASIESTLTELKSTQSQLIQSEKMASLGELTAGIAHEIQNPLNFVNNFSEVNMELIAELREELEAGNLGNVKAIADDIAINEEKIKYHGYRADAIVKGMLQHSRSSSGQKVPTGINALADEYLRLSYHGLRAKDNSFNADLITNFDPDLPKINVIPQDIGRVLLNLINNAFYAVSVKAVASEDGHIKPTVTVSTKNLDGRIQISVHDNGSGIPDSIIDKIFQPFFTTKPTGQGTGLGLSLAYDIVKAHGGELQVESIENEGTTFILLLPV